MAAAEHKLTAYCFDPESKSFATKSTTKTLGVNDVLIKTTHSGVCYTDVHAKGTGCGLGHEGVGIVREVGQAVTHMKPGDRVGWGWLHQVQYRGARSSPVTMLRSGSLVDVAQHA